MTLEAMMLLSEAFEARRFALVLGNMSPRTEESLQVSKRVFISYFGDINIQSISLDGIRQWHHKQLQRKLSPDTIRGYILHLRVVLRYCRANGIDALDPTLLVVPKRTAKIPDVISPEDVAVLIDSWMPMRGRSIEATLRNKTIISMLYASGMRVSELCSLERNMVYPKRATIIGKGSKVRLVFWDDRTEILLKSYLATRKDNKPELFISAQSHRKMNRHDVGEIFAWMQKNTPYTCIHAHTLRHAYATNLAQNGMPIHSLAKLMGHSNIATTSIYLSVTDIRLEEEYNRFHSIKELSVNEK